MLGNDEQDRGRADNLTWHSQQQSHYMELPFVWQSGPAGRPFDAHIIHEHVAGRVYGRDRQWRLDA